MPTAVESYAKLGAVVVQLPNLPAPAIQVMDPGAASIPGRNGTAAITAFQHHVAAANPDNETIGGRSGVGALPVVHPHQPVHRAVHHPTHLVSSNNEVIGGRTGLAPVATFHPAQAAGRSLLSAVQNEELLLRPLVPQIGAALQAAIPQPGQKMLEAIGVGTNSHTLGVLIRLLRNQGFHVTIASCDGSVRPGFAGPTAILRAHGGATAGQFLQQLSSTLRAH